jgi:hypothetical protein
MKEKTVALYTGRHEIKTADGELVEEGIFDALPFEMKFEPMGHHAKNFLMRHSDLNVLHLYVTGFTPALTSLLIQFNKLMYYERPNKLILYHFDRDSAGYLPQEYFIRE